jgi:hypothetical protein
MISTEIKRAAYLAFAAAEEAWSKELARCFGRNAGEARYYPEGKGKPGEPLHALCLERDRCRIAWEQAFGVGRECRA